MVLGYNARDATMDLDTAIRQHHGAVLAEARVVAAELGLPSWWLNEQATPYLPPGDDSEARAVLGHFDAVTQMTPRVRQEPPPGSKEPNLLG
jgi:hypothetical protein